MLKTLPQKLWFQEANFPGDVIAAIAAEFPYGICKIDETMTIIATHPIFLPWFWNKQEEFWFQLRVGNQWFLHFTMDYITMKSFNSVLKLNLLLKPNLKPE